MRATSFIFGIILTSLVMTVMGGMILDMGKNYDRNYDNTTLASYDKLSVADAQVDELQESIGGNTSQSSGVLDLVGFYIGQAVASLKVTFTSLNAGVEMVGSATEDIGLPDEFRSAFTSIIMVFIILGVIIASMLRTKNL